MVWLPVVPYIPMMGVQYARRFALHAWVPETEQLFYYSLEDNCTNYISQCVWAAYGGWLPEGSTAENAARIRADVQMVTGVWYGSRWHIGSTRWCRVEEFYSYVTRPKPKGPVAWQVASGTFDTVDPSVLRVGDVVQLVVATYRPDRFGHGLYVTQAGRSWDTVQICCQSYDRLDAPMTAFAQYPNIYTQMRVLRFLPSVW